MPRDVGLSVTVRQKTPRCFRVYPGLRYRHISENLTSLPADGAGAEDHGDLVSLLHHHDLSDRPRVVFTDVGVRAWLVEGHIDLVRRVEGASAPRPILSRHGVNQCPVVDERHRRPHVHPRLKRTERIFIDGVPSPTRQHFALGEGRGLNLVGVRDATGKAFPARPRRRREGWQRPAER